MRLEIAARFAQIKMLVLVQMKIRTNTSIIFWEALRCFFVLFGIGSSSPSQTICSQQNSHPSFSIRTWQTFIAANAVR
jgi:hypothetical protein